MIEKTMFGKTVPVLGLLFAFGVAPAASADSAFIIEGLDAEVLSVEGDFERLSDDVLSELRGGFLDNALGLSLDYEEYTVINGELVNYQVQGIPGISRTSFSDFLNRPELANLPAGQSFSRPEALMDPSVLTEGFVTTIQNTLDMQTIEHTRVFHIELDNIELLRNLPLTRSFETSLINSINASGGF